MSNTIDVDLSLESKSGPAPLPNEGVFWFLRPQFESLATSHGKRIDLYGEVEFRLGELPLIDRLIDASRRACSEAAPSWDQSVGRQTQPPPSRDLTVRVSREDVLSWLSALETVVADARETRAAVRFVGD